MNQVGIDVFLYARAAEALPVQAATSIMKCPSKTIRENDEAIDQEECSTVELDHTAASGPVQTQNISQYLFRR